MHRDITFALNVQSAPEKLHETCSGWYNYSPVLDTQEVTFSESQVHVFEDIQSLIHPTSFHSIVKM